MFNIRVCVLLVCIRRWMWRFLAALHITLLVDEYHHGMRNGLSFLPRLSTFKVLFTLSAHPPSADAASRASLGSASCKRICRHGQQGSRSNSQSDILLSRVTSDSRLKKSLQDKTGLTLASWCSWKKLDFRAARFWASSVRRGQASLQGLLQRVSQPGFASLAPCRCLEPPPFFPPQLKCTKLKAMHALTPSKHTSSFFACF